MTHGTLAGRLLCDLIAGREHPWAALYDPGRTTLRAVGEFARETGNMAAQYADWLTGSEVEGVDEIANGEGAVLSAASERSPSTATGRGASTRSRRSARTSAAWSSGTGRSGPGTARATDRVSTPGGAC